MQTFQVSLTVLLLCLSTGLARAESSSLLKSTHAELHHRFNGAASTAAVAEQGAMLLTIEHYSEQSYGDWFLFFDLLGRHQGSYSKAAEIYVHVEPRFSLPRTFGLESLRGGLIRDLYLCFRYNDADVSYLNRALLLGLSADLATWNALTLSATAYLRKEDNNRLAPHLGTVWGADTTLFGEAFSFRGFVDLYRNDANWVLNMQPQIIWSLASLGAKSLSLGTEQQVTLNFYGTDSGWTWMPTLFMKLGF